ncbi:hypothetical protein ACHAWF_017609 [Thalassiosira exigua]
MMRSFLRFAVSLIWARLLYPCRGQQTSKASVSFVSPTVPKLTERKHVRQSWPSESFKSLSSASADGARRGAGSRKAKGSIPKAKPALNKGAKKSPSNKTVGKKSKASTKSNASSTKKKSKRTTAKAKSPSVEEASADDFYIQFSRVFQRHVVYRSHPGKSQPGESTGEVIRSFEFLDRAVESFPNARVLAPKDLPFPPPSCSLVYPDENDADGDDNQNLAVSRGRPIDAAVEEEECETTIAGMGLWTVCELQYDGAADEEGQERRRERADDALRALLRLVSSESPFVAPRHFFRLDPRQFAARGHTPEGITLIHFKVVNMLSRGGGGGGGSSGLALSPPDIAFVLQSFPQLCLYDCGELEGLVRFLLQPLPPAGGIPSVTMVADRVSGKANVDCKYGCFVAVRFIITLLTLIIGPFLSQGPSLSDKGFGAGLTTEQATKAVRMMPELLALYYEDSRKPSLIYMFNQMQSSVPPKLIDEANVQLELEGTDPSDAYTFAYLRSLGVSWSQLRILTSALPLWKSVNLEPGWELLQRGPVRSMLKRPSLDYLRQRLQIGPDDVYRLLKTHSRLSTYDHCKRILPILDRIQRKLALSSDELRKLTLRMPSLMGMGLSTFDDRLEFFINEAGMSMDDVKGAAIKQPSLLQYNVDSTMRPKLHFFRDELGIPQSSISRVLSLAPASMGLSLTENLRPKVASVMSICALHPHEVGYIVTTSPQTLLLSQKNKIEPTLKFLSQSLMLRDRELGALILSAPRILVQGLETSLVRKMELLMAHSKGEKSKEVASAIVRKNPALLALSNAVLEDRIDRCPEGEDVTTWLLPSKKGRRKKELPYASLIADPILVSIDSTSFDSLKRIYSSVQVAAADLGITATAVLGACDNGIPLDGNSVCSLKQYRSQSPTPTTTPKLSTQKNIVNISLFCAGSTYPSDNTSVARGQRRTGGLSIQVFLEGPSNEESFLRDFSVAAQSCFGIHVPFAKDNDGSKFTAVFPLVNPSRNRCELFACAGALRILEALLSSRRHTADYAYDIKVYTDSTYAWRLVRSRDQLLELGSYFTSREMLSHMDMASFSANIDILHPLTRSFSRLNGCVEPARSSHQSFKHVRVDFAHSTDGIDLNSEGLRHIAKLKSQAKSAARWQYKNERNLV